MGGCLNIVGKLEEMPVTTKDLIMIRSSEDSNGCWNWQWRLNTRGYGYLVLRKRHKKTGAHQLSYIAFNGDYDSSLWVLHKCNNRACVNPEHLYLGNAKQNRQDAINAGTAKIPDNRGERCGTSKLKETQVLEIRSLAGKLTKRELGEIYGVCRQHIGDIISRKVWGHL